jgi:hypothetical protein
MFGQMGRAVLSRCARGDGRYSPVEACELAHLGSHVRESC